MYTNTNSLQLICENSSSANFTCRVIFRVILENFTQAQKYFTQVSLVANSTSALILTSKASTTEVRVFELKSVCLPWGSTGLVRPTRCLSLPPRRLHDSWLTSRRCDWKKPFGGIGPFIYIAHCPQGPCGHHLGLTKPNLCLEAELGVAQGAAKRHEGRHVRG